MNKQSNTSPARRAGTAVAAMALAILAAGCAAPSQSGGAYSSSAVRGAQRVQDATLESVRAVQIERDRGSALGGAGLGGATGAAIGGVAGSTVGQGKGSLLGTIAGAVAGGVAGSYAEQAMGRRAGVELTVRFANGERMAVVQDADPNEQFAPGQRVRVLTDSRGTIRVAPH